MWSSSKRANEFHHTGRDCIEGNPPGTINAAFVLWATQLDNVWVQQAIGLNTRIHTCAICGTNKKEIYFGTQKSILFCHKFELGALYTLEPKQEMYIGWFGYAEVFKQILLVAGISV